MVDLSKLPSSTNTSSIDKAMILTRRCAEARNGAIRRASQRLERPFSRIREIWYGGASRNDAALMDRVRRGVENAEIARAVAAMEFLAEKLLSSPSSASYPAIGDAGEALLAAAAMLSETSRCRVQDEAKTTQE